MSTKFIIAALQKLAVTLVSTGNGMKRRFYSNFDPVNKAILTEPLAEA